MGVLIGAVLTAVAGLIGLLISKKTEHQQWLRNQRLEVYSSLLRQAHASSRSLDFYRATKEQLKTPLDDIKDTYNSKLFIVAPYAVRSAAQNYLVVLEVAGQQVNIDDDDKFAHWSRRRSEAYQVLETAIRKDLGTNDKVRIPFRSRVWRVIYSFIDPPQRWYYKRTGVAWVTKHPTRVMRRHQRERQAADTAQRVE
ncbi:hypothetical protein [Pseudarthrobacter niigatensis]|uniref:Gas vesicle protein n=1 Tax=Pseudarthrobacter niigatensis TaxID=369935 RepID=A0AAJ1SUE9_9MICC|nr:hypothetical protein [Pseudarthrobacter niigatensis]MDQ0144966.1 gas vesicle protein [Pseudarthrobacter niigatensis]MDQ0264403.1 gas vesicle protein [Pseudarthrobacter niigatensis]